MSRSLSRSRSPVMARSRSRSPLMARSRSRSPVDKLEFPDSPSKHSQHSEQQIDDEKFRFRRLLLTNTPPYWKWERVKEFLVQKCNSPVVQAQVPHVFMKKQGEFTIKFTSSLPCSICYKILNGCEVEGRKLSVTPFEEDIDGRNNKPNNKANSFMNKNPKPHKKLIKTSSGFNPDQNANETYGLSMNFLKSLGIKPPLITKVFVGNLPTNIDEEKLREVFSFAGVVVSVYIIKKVHQNNAKRSAKVEFEHPVEAVQAISMFHRQELYGRAMVVQMDQQPHTQKLPEGLASLGPGLGPNGEPLKGIRNLVEIQPLKQLIHQEISQLKTNRSNEIAQTSSFLPSNAGSILGNPMQNIMTPLNINTMGLNPLNTSAMFGLNVTGQTNIPAWQGLLQQNMGNDLATTLAALQAHNVNTKNLSTFSQTLGLEQNKPKTSNSSNGNTKSSFAGDTRREGSGDDKEKSSMTSSNMLVFNNLPPSVTVQALNNKMRELGEVMFAEITGQGRAIVRFHDNEDAERCVKIFDRSKVDGQTIEVKFF